MCISHGLLYVPVMLRGIALTNSEEKFKINKNMNETRMTTGLLKKEDENLLVIVFIPEYTKSRESFK